MIKRIIQENNSLVNKAFRELNRISTNPLMHISKNQSHGTHYKISGDPL